MRKNRIYREGYAWIHSWNNLIPVVEYFIYPYRINNISRRIRYFVIEQFRITCSKRSSFSQGTYSKLSIWESLLALSSKQHIKTFHSGKTEYLWWVMHDSMVGIIKFQSWNTYPIPREETNILRRMCYFPSEKCRRA